MSYVDPSGKLFRVLDLDIESEYCANTIILFKDNLDDYRLILHLSKNNEYFVLSDSTDLRITLRVNDLEPINDAINLYDYNLGCLVFNTSKQMFETIADEHTKYTCTLNIVIHSLFKETQCPTYFKFKIPITILPGSEDDNKDDSSPKSKVESYYATGGKHSKSVNPPFSKYINY